MVLLPQSASWSEFCLPQPRSLVGAAVCATEPNILSRSLILFLRRLGPRVVLGMDEVDVERAFALN
jgi:hypothetical protein